MLIDLTCPIELRKYELLRDDRGNTRAYIRLFNLTERTVIGYSATVQWFNGITRASVTENVTVDETRVPPRSDFKFVHSIRCGGRADFVEMYFSKVVFADGETWEPRDGSLVDVGEQPMLEGNELDLLRAAAGGDAVQFPQVQDQYWRCVCGRINFLNRASCLRCGRDRTHVLKDLNVKAILGGRDTQNRARHTYRSVLHAKRNRRSLSFLKAVLVVLLVILFALIGYGIGRGSATDSPAPPATTEAPFGR